MKILKRIFLVLLVVIGAAVLIGFLMPSVRHVERSVSMNVKPDVVFEQVNNLKNWPNWSPWYKLDPNSKIVYSEPSSGAGAFYTWDSQNSNVGKGKMSITESVPGQVVKVRLEFEGMNPSEGAFTFEPEGEGTKATWSFDASMGNNPFFRLMGVMMDKMLGKTFEDGLADMKKVSEAAPVISPEPAPAAPVDSSK